MKAVWARPAKSNRSNRSRGVSRWSGDAGRWCGLPSVTEPGNGILLMADPEPSSVSEEVDRTVVRRVLERGFNVDREAVTLLSTATDIEDTLDLIIDHLDAERHTITGADVRSIVDGGRTNRPEGNPSASSGTNPTKPREDPAAVPDETRGSTSTNSEPIDVSGDVTGESTGTGEYADFVAVFRDRYRRLSQLLRGRVNHRPMEAIDSMSGGSTVETIGMISDIRSTANGHWLLELEDPTGSFPVLVMKDRELAATVDELVLDEVIGISGTLSDDAGIVFVDDILFPDVPRTNTPNRASRSVGAVFISDIHVGSQEFAAAAWEDFADWLATDDAESIEYLLICGDMVEGVGVYPGQDEELDIVDIYDQYTEFSERLKSVPGDLEIIMIPGNHDAVRLAEPQPAPIEELRTIMSAHDARIFGNPSTVTIEGVSILLYHGMSLDEIIAEAPSDIASYESPEGAMRQLLRKRHLAPTFGGKMRIAPEDRDYLTIESVPDIFHTGHVHKFGAGSYHGVQLLNTGCWQHQTAFQRSVNIDPDVGVAPVVDLQTFDVTLRKFV